MERTCFALPVLAGQQEAARAFLQELEGQRKGDYAASEQRLGIQKEVWALQATSQGAMLVVYIESLALGAAFQRFAASRVTFDVWFKDVVRVTTGADLNIPPTGPMSEVLSVYEA